MTLRRCGCAFLADSDVGVAAVEKVIGGSCHSPRSTTYLKSGGACKAVLNWLPL